MKTLVFIRSVGFIFLCNANVVFGRENVCENKHWLQSPIVASSNDGMGIGGTGFHTPIKSEFISEGESGIGGTGLTPPTQSDTLLAKKEDESGIGGTGIVGIISGFGSICVNGMEIHFKETTPIIEDGVQTLPSRLALGQTVSVLTHINDNGYYAKEIRVLHEVNGLVTTIDSANNTFELLGQTVHLPADLIQQITLGEQVSISGNRLNDGSIEALRVDKSDKPIEKLSLIGPLEKETASGNFHIGKQIIDIPATQTALQMGDEVRVQGTLKDNILHADIIEHNPRWSFFSRVDQILLQGHVRDSGATHFNIDGIRVNVNHTENPTPQTGQYVGVSVQLSEKGSMILNHWQQIAWPERGQIHHVETSLKDGKIEIESISTDKRTDNIPHSTLEHHNIDHHDFEKHDVNKPDIDKPEIEKHEISHFDIDRPDTNHTDIDKPTLLHLNVTHPGIQIPRH
jgi:Domain of unknown function (DUF5666)